ncbi:Lipase_GDSL domain-containing protein, partial [Cephalotus follicularis]
KLFVFGDSYVDTGNWGKFANSWKEPYGITFPGKPVGRFSDGRVLTDYIASFLGIRTPVAYSEKVQSNLKHGINFAYGGTGVFDTLIPAPNMTTQIRFFQHLLKDKVYTKHDLRSSVALVSVAGNDYAAYILRNGSLEGISTFTKSLIKQLAVDLKQIHRLGVKKIAITGIGPVGCLPLSTAPHSYSDCNETFNLLAKFHNQILHQAVKNLNKESKKCVFVTLDIYSAFMSAIKKQKTQAGKLKSKYTNPLKPCCVGITNRDTCGSVDEKGTKKYVVCKNPKLSFFWDAVHPSQNGWHEVYLALRHSLHKL